MSYFVAWAEEAVEDLEAVLNIVNEITPVVVALRELERVLAADPEGAGESRPDDQRVAFSLPLAVRYEVFDQTRRVQVVAAWYVRPR